MDMGEFMFGILWPIWIGIAGNVLLSIINISMIGHYGPYATWYMRKAAMRILIGMWGLLICLSIFNGLTA